jgi:capsule biosynthesis phosphatase
MIVIIPLGGIGERFKNNGYSYPKALIRVFGKPILYYLLDNLDYSKISMVYIPYNKEYSSYRIEDMLQKDYPNIIFNFLCLNENTRGAAETLNIALNKLTIPDCPIISLDGDNYYTTNIIELWNGDNKLITIKDENDIAIYSYVKEDPNSDNVITDIVEKEKISDYACTGAYGFSSYKQLLKYTQYILDNNIRQKSEFYISTVIREMLNDCITFSNIVINTNSWTCLGTPLQVRSFYNNMPKISCVSNIEKIKPLRICFDLDNTLVSYPKITGDYTSVEPIYKNIAFLKYLKSFGHTIIIYTARRMKTHNSNVGKVMADIGIITFETLNRFDIPYDEIYFGKPYANVYIDDLALNAYDNLEKSLGFYMDNIIPRSFNEINETVMDIITKKSNDLRGEIYYYYNIPNSIKDMFPSFINYDSETYKWYRMEKIKGLSLSTLYTSELLTSTILKHVMNSINRIHNATINKDNIIGINIYANYYNKMKLRYETYDYSRFENSENIYNKIQSNLLNYEKNNKGKLCVIHGDTVMTNIIINNHDKIKFIDMRGKLGDKETIYGDYLYDWAKLYQSLLGYDLILQDKEVSFNYKKNLIECFENFFIELFSTEEFNELKIITNSLLFTLLPLHDNDKCIKYYNMIDIVK